MTLRDVSKRIDEQVSQKSAVILRRGKTVLQLVKATIGLVVLTLCLMGCDQRGSHSTTPTSNTATLPAGTKTCFNCGGSGKAACSAPGCKKGFVDCPGPCLKLSRGTWEHMHVEGHSDSDVWQRFQQSDGTSRSWNQGHVGQVIEMQGGQAVNIGNCKICGGTGKVKCSECAGTGEIPCSICDGKKFVPENWTAFNNPKLKNPPKTIQLKDGRTIMGKIESRVGSVVYIRTESGKQEEVSAQNIVSEGTSH
jgi:hypothetical protein